MGSLFTQKNPIKQWRLGESHFQDTNEELPITGNNLTRNNIFNVLWLHLADVMAKRFLTHKQYRNCQHFSWIIIYQKIEALTEILAYSFSKKKPAGLASESKNSKKDTLLSALKFSLKELEDIKIKTAHKEFYPTLEIEINSLIKMHKKINMKYKQLIYREESLINNVIRHMSVLRQPGYKNTRSAYATEEIKILIKESITFFEKNGHKSYNGYKPIMRLAREYHDINELNENGRLVRIKPKKKNTKELRGLENLGNRKQKLYANKPVPKTANTGLRSSDITLPLGRKK